MQNAGFCCFLPDVLLMHSGQIQEKIRFTVWGFYNGVGVKYHSFLMGRIEAHEL